MTDKFDDESETMSEEKFDKVLETLKKVFGPDNIVVVDTKDDIDNLELELELRDYLRSGKRLN